MKIQIRLFILLLTGLLSVVGNLALADEAIDTSLSKAMLLEPLAVNINTASAEEMAEEIVGNKTIVDSNIEGF